MAALRTPVIAVTGDVAVMSALLLRHPAAQQAGRVLRLLLRRAAHAPSGQDRQLASSADFSAARRRAAPRSLLRVPRPSAGSWPRPPAAPASAWRLGAAVARGARRISGCTNDEEREQPTSRRRQDAAAFPGLRRRHAATASASAGSSTAARRTTRSRRQLVAARRVEADGGGDELLDLLHLLRLRAASRPRRPCRPAFFVWTGRCRGSTATDSRAMSPRGAMRVAWSSC